MTYIYIYIYIVVINNLLFWISYRYRLLLQDFFFFFFFTEKGRIGILKWKKKYKSAKKGPATTQGYLTSLGLATGQQETQIHY